MRLLAGLVMALLALGVVLGTWTVLSSREARDADVEPEGAGAHSSGEQTADLAAAVQPGAETQSREAVEREAVEVEDAELLPEDAAGAEATSGTAMLVMRVLDESGVAVAERDVGVELVETLRRTSWSAPTDAQGVLKVPLKLEGQNKVRLEEVRALHVSGGHDDPTRGARIELEGRIAPGINDLGEIVLRLLPLLAAGVVQNPAGIPVPGANVMVTARGGGGRWIQTGVDGLFEARGWAQPASAVQILVSHDAAAPIPPLEVPLGTSGVIVTLVGGGRIEGRVLLDPGVPASVVSAFTVSAGAAPARSVHPLENGDLFFLKLAPGKHELRVLLDGAAEPLLQLEGLVVENAVTLRPPELNPLDLRGRLRAVEVRVLGPDGSPCDAAIYHWPAVGGDLRSCVTTLHRRDTPTTLYTAAAAIDVAAAARGMGTAEQPNVTGDAVTLVLAGAREVHLRLPAPPALPQGDVLRASLVPLLADEVQDRRAALSSGWVAFDSAGVCRLWTTRAGEHDLLLQLGAIERKVSRLSISDVAGAQVHRVDFSADELERWVRERE